MVNEKLATSLYQAKLRGNIYVNDAIGQEAMRNNQPVYLRDLYQCSNAEEAITIYNKHKANFGNSYVFVLEVYRFFQERYGNVESTNQIIRDNELLFEENPLALKALAYIYQSNGNFEKANALYKKCSYCDPIMGNRI